MTASPRRGDRLEYVRADGRVEPVTVVRRWPTSGALFLTLRTDDGRYRTFVPEVSDVRRCGWRRVTARETAGGEE